MMRSPASGPACSPLLWPTLSCTYRPALISCCISPGHCPQVIGMAAPNCQMKCHNFQIWGRKAKFIKRIPSTNVFTEEFHFERKTSSQSVMNSFHALERCIFCPFLKWNFGVAYQRALPRGQTIMCQFSAESGNSDYHHAEKSIQNVAQLRWNYLHRTLQSKVMAKIVFWEITHCILHCKVCVCVCVCVCYYP